MSDIEKFVTKLSEDQAFAKQVGEIVENNEGNEILDKLAALGKEHDLNVSAEEIEEARKALASYAQTEGELDEEQLEQVSGGGVAAAIIGAGITAAGSAGALSAAGIGVGTSAALNYDKVGEFFSKW